MRVSRECPTEHALDSVHPVKANRPRGMRSKAEGEPMAVLPAIVPAPRLAPTEATRRWAALLQQIFITQASVIDQILAHLRGRAARESHAGPRSPPSTRAPASRGASRAPRPPADATTAP